MSDVEIALTDLGELVTRELAKEYKLYDLEQSKLQKLLEMILKRNWVKL